MSLQPLGTEIYGGAQYGNGNELTQYHHTVSLAISYAVGSTAGSSSTSAIWLYGLSRFGDGLRISLLPKQNALGISYVITPSMYASPIPASYTIQRPNTVPLLAYYLITPPSRFSINGDGSIIRPDQINYALRPVTARTLLAGPILQGYETMTWTYSVLSWSEWNRIISHYSPASPVVTLVYPDATGTWAQRQATMHPPAYGTMQTFLIYNATLSFSIIPT